MWTLTPYGKTRRNLPGVPWRDLTDSEYAAARRAHPGMEDQGYFVKAEPATEAAKADAKVTATPPAAGGKSDG